MMELAFRNGKLTGIKEVSFEIEKGKKTFKIEVVNNGGQPEAVIMDMDSDVENPVLTKRADSLEDLLHEVIIHLCDVPGCD